MKTILTFLLSLLAVLPVFSAGLEGYQKNGFSTNAEPIFILSNGLILSNKVTGQWWKLFGTNGNTIATLSDITGGSGGSSLWTDFGSFIAPSGFTGQVQITTNGSIYIHDGLDQFGDDSANQFIAYGEVNRGSKGYYNGLAVGILNGTNATFELQDFQVFGGTNNGHVSMRLFRDDFTVNRFTVNQGINPDVMNLNLKVADQIVTDFNPTAPDGTTPYTLDTSLLHTSGNLVEFKNAGTAVNFTTFEGGQVIGSNTLARIGSPDLGYALESFSGPDDPIAGRRGIYIGTQDANSHEWSLKYQSTTNTSEFSINADEIAVVHFNPTSGSSSLPFYFASDKTHTSGNFFYLDDNGTASWIMDFAGNTVQSGYSQAENGFASRATNATLAVVSTGITNSLAVLYVVKGFTGTSVVETNTIDNTGFSRGTITAPIDIILQPGSFLLGSSCATLGKRAL